MPAIRSVIRNALPLGESPEGSRSPGTCDAGLSFKTGSPKAGACRNEMKPNSGEPPLNQAPGILRCQMVGFCIRLYPARLLAMRTRAVDVRLPRAFVVVAMLFQFPLRKNLDAPRDALITDESVRPRDDADLALRFSAKATAHPIVPGTAAPSRSGLAFDDVRLFAQCHPIARIESDREYQTERRAAA